MNWICIEELLLVGKVSSKFSLMSVRGSEGKADFVQLKDIWNWCKIGGLGWWFGRKRIVGL